MAQKLQILDVSGKKTGDFDFTLAGNVREDIFKRAVIAENSLFYQQSGKDPEAGKKQVIHLSKRRRKFRTTYGRGQSRTPKKVMWARGRQMRFVGAFAPNTIGGRKTHGPNANKELIKNINNKEWSFALRTGLLGAFDKGCVVTNGQRVPESYPFILDDSVEKIDKTKTFVEMLEKLGFGDEIERSSIRKVRAGRGTMRGRTYKDKRGPLVVVSNFEVPLFKAAKNVKGFEVMSADLLMVSDLGMSEKPGRAVIFTSSALKEIMEAFN